MNTKGSGIVYLFVTVLILALLAVFLMRSITPSSSYSSAPASNPVQQAQEAVDATNERLEQYK